MEEEFSDISSTSINMFLPFVGGILMMCIVAFAVLNVDNLYRQKNQEFFQNGLGAALRAYSGEYSLETKDLASISEGYLTQEDLNIYKIKSNPINLDHTRASDYFFNVMESNTPFAEPYLKTYGMYIINIVTKFNPNPVYLVSILKDGEIAMVSSQECANIESVQNLIQQTLNVTIDIATGFNSSIRKAQKYDRDNGKTGSNQDTYSTYSTNMAIATDIPIKGMFGTKINDVHELQTYSIVRSKDG